MKFVIFGPPGSGKGTMAAMIERDYGLKHITMSNLLQKARETDGELREIMDSGELVPDEIVKNIIAATIESADDFILDGFPRTLSQAIFLDQLLKGDIDAFIDLQVSDETIKERLSKRRRSDDTPAVIENRLAVYREKTMPAWTYMKSRFPHVKIKSDGSGDDSIAACYAMICEALENGLEYELSPYKLT